MTGSKQVAVGGSGSPGFLGTELFRVMKSFWNWRLGVVFRTSR